MARMKRKLPMHVRMARIRDVKQNFSNKKRLSVIFPNCIGTFPECKVYNEEMPIEERPECNNCPHNAKTKSLGGVIKMSDEEKQSKKKEKRENRLAELKAKKWEDMGAGEKAYVSKMVNKGEFDYQIPEKKVKETVATENKEENSEQGEEGQ